MIQLNMADVLTEECDKQRTNKYLYIMSVFSAGWLCNSCSVPWNANSRTAIFLLLCFSCQSSVNLWIHRSVLLGGMTYLFFFFSCSYSVFWFSLDKKLISFILHQTLKPNNKTRLKAISFNVMGLSWVFEWTRYIFQIKELHRITLWYIVIWGNVVGVSTEAASSVYRTNSTCAYLTIESVEKQEIPQPPQLMCHTAPADREVL